MGPTGSSLGLPAGQGLRGGRRGREGRRGWHHPQRKDPFGVRTGRGREGRSKNQGPLQRPRSPAWRTLRTPALGSRPGLETYTRGSAPLLLSGPLQVRPAHGTRVGAGGTPSHPWPPLAQTQASEGPSHRGSRGQMRSGAGGGRQRRGAGRGQGCGASGREAQDPGPQLWSRSQGLWPLSKAPSPRARSRQTSRQTPAASCPQHSLPPGHPSPKLRAGGAAWVRGQQSAALPEPTPPRGTSPCPPAQPSVPTFPTHLETHTPPSQGSWKVSTGWLY